MVRLPPFFALRALEAAARRRSYRRAGEELAITHGAISHHIRNLEAELGVKLFERQVHDMVPTPDAERLAGEVGRALQILRGAVAGFHGPPDRGPLVLSVPTQFAGRWLGPRLSRLLAMPAGVRLAVQVDDACADFVNDGVDIAVRIGAGDWPDLEIEPLIQERLIPVCSPVFAALHRIGRAEDLLHIPLLHHARYPWSLWFGPLGLEAPPPDGVRFDDTVLTLEAAAQGLGVALARSFMVERDLATRRLVRLESRDVASPTGFFIVWRADSRKLGRIHRLRDWLLAEAAIERAERRRIMEASRSLLSAGK